MIVHCRPSESHVILEMPHSAQYTYLGHRATGGIPQAVVRMTRFESDAVRRTIGKGCDAAVPEMTGYGQLLRHHPVTGLRTTLPRAFVDVNRARSEVSGLALEGASLDADHSGVIWSRTMTTGLSADELNDRDRALAIIRERSEPMLSAPYSPEQFEELMVAAYDPYHAKMREQHQRIVARHGACIHLALHSIAPYALGKFDGTYVCGPRARRGPLDERLNTMPDVILIHNGFKACAPEFVDLVRGIFQQFGLIVEDGKGPLLGDNGVTGMYGGRDHVHVLGIEHVTHGGEEPGRINGDPTVDKVKARRHQRAYEAAVRALLQL